jgi:sentrin-specific protease 1
MVNEVNNSVDIFSHEYVFFPINVSNNHWHLFAVDIKNKCIYLVDSIPSLNTNRYRKTFISIAQFLSDVYVLRKGTVDNDGWNFRILESPEQPNGVDCGVYVCLSMIMLSDNVELNYGQREINNFRNVMIKSFIDNQISRHWLQVHSDIVTNIIK